ncbi:MAG: V-type ATP synthase subunit I [Clostridia bacterium]|nr:V-type ATP synthase subunit I [Clostridia bacterium]
MQKVSIIAHDNDKGKILRILLKSGNAEMISNEEVVITDSEKERKAKVEAKKFRINFAINFIKETIKNANAIKKHNKEKDTIKANFKKENKLISLEEYENISSNDIELMTRIDEMEKINNEIVDLKSEKMRWGSLKDQLLPYQGLSIPFSKVKSDDYLYMAIGVCDAKNADNLISNLPQESFYERSDSNNTVALVIGTHISNKEELEKLLLANEFVKSSFTYDETASTKIDEIDKKFVSIDEKVNSLTLKSLEYIDLLGTLKILYDYMDIKIAKYNAYESSVKTQKAIMLECWVPQNKVAQIKDEILNTCKAVEIFNRDPLEGEKPPTLLKNNKVVGSSEAILGMFGFPTYGEKDPSIFVALYYFLIFGIMIGDAGYGLVMTIACFLFLAIKKPVKNSGKMIFLFAMCGIATFIWGVLFGGWFAIELPANSFLSKISWFNPLNEPLKMFILALGVGLVHMGTGYILSGIARIKNKQVLKGIFSDFGWVVIFIGLFLLFPKISVFLGALKPEESQPWFDVCSKIAIYVALAGFAMILIGGAVGKKNPIKMVGGALGSAYGIINVVSDLLSYSRLFGLGLTTGVIGYVMNSLASLVAVGLGGGAAWIIGAVILVGGHIFNLGINLLGAYVHDSRLQFIEFFGRFYDGQGRAFKPLGYDLKYTYLDN